MDQSYQSRQMDRKPRSRDNYDDNIKPLSADESLIKKIVIDGDVEALVNYADKVGENLKNLDLKTNQIRNVFGSVRQIQMKWDSDPDQSFREAVLLIPKLGYYAQRQKSSKGSKSQGMETFQNIFTPALKQLLEPGIDNNKKKTRFQNIADFMEAVVAYHKKYGGGD
ncbi:MAG: type III-A CRISPR-associated protein Csm2 [Anaerolineaceae bacterium]